MFVLRSTYLAKVRECEDLQSENNAYVRRNDHLLERLTELDRIKFDTFAVAKLISLLNRHYGIPYDDCARRTESDAISERVLKTLNDEFRTLRDKGLAP